MSHFLESKRVRTILIILGSLVIILVVFGFGIAIGYDRAGFGSQFDQNYYRNFNGGPVNGSPMEGMGPAPMSEHGIAGSVIDVSSSTISVTDQQNDEHSITISTGTIIREDNDTITIDDVKTGDQIVVIGDPNAQGQVEARFIRVFTSSSSIPTDQGQ